VKICSLHEFHMHSILAVVLAITFYPIAGFAQNSPRDSNALSRNDVLCDKPIMGKCKRVQKPTKVHESADPDRVYVPFQREPNFTRPRRPFEE
jgi:hypothetical protein